MFFKVVTLLCVVAAVLADGPSCKLIKNLKATAVKSKSATITWTNNNCIPADAPLSFEMDLRSKDAKGVVVWNNITAFGMTEHAYSGLIPNTRYSISILPHMGVKLGEPDFYERSDVVYFNTTASKSH